MMPGQIQEQTFQKQKQCLTPHLQLDQTMDGWCSFMYAVICAYACISFPFFVQGQPASKMEAKSSGQRKSSFGHNGIDCVYMKWFFL